MFLALIRFSEKSAGKKQNSSQIEFSHSSGRGSIQISGNLSLFVIVIFCLRCFILSAENTIENSPCMIFRRKRPGCHKDTSHAKLQTSAGQVIDAKHP